MKLRPGIQALAVKLQEQDDGLSNSDVCRWLSDALASGSDEYSYYIDHFGDGASGDVIYSCRGDMKRAGYEITKVNGKMTAQIDFDNAIDVLPRTVYEEEADEEDHYASMESANREGGPLYVKVPVYERFISKDERDAMDSKDFAGKGKSYPIRKAGDVMAAVRSIGRAGSGNYDAGTLKRNIISIAKRKGFGSSLPKAWQSGGGASDSSEAARDIALDGEFVALKEGAVGQDGTALLKLISPGWGSCGYYPAEVLERDGPRVFPKGTKNFWNHQTDAEEAARPEGDLRDLASVLQEDARFEKHGPDGPGLYAKAKVFEQFRQPVDDLAKHIGMSIRASGKAREGEIGGTKGRIIEQLTRGTSVDYVTTPGAGGKILQLFEAARGRQSQTENEGEAMEVKEAEAKIRKLNERLALRDAKDHAAEKIGSERLNEATKQRLIARVVEMAPLTADGELDTKKFDEIIAREVKDEVTYLASVTGRRIVTGMGDGAALGEGGNGEKLGKKERKRLREAARELDDDFEEGMKEVGRTLGLSKEGRKLFAVGRGEVA